MAQLAPLTADLKGERTTTMTLLRIKLFDFENHLLEALWQQLFLTLFVPIVFVKKEKKIAGQKFLYFSHVFFPFNIESFRSRALTHYGNFKLLKLDRFFTSYIVLSSTNFSFLTQSENYYYFLLPLKFKNI